MSCTCNTPNQNKTLTCFRNVCNISWLVEKKNYEKKASCPQHHNEISICGGGRQLCRNCERNGYRIAYITSNDSYDVVKEFYIKEKMTGSTFDMTDFFS